MSIASELSALNGHIISAYDEISTMGGTIPANKNMANLPTAIASIPSGGSGKTIDYLGGINPQLFEQHSYTINLANDTTYNQMTPSSSTQTILSGSQSEYTINSAVMDLANYDYIVAQDTIAVLKYTSQPSTAYEMSFCLASRHFITKEFNENILTNTFTATFLYYMPTNRVPSFTRTKSGLSMSLTNPSTSSSSSSPKVSLKNPIVQMASNATFMDNSSWQYVDASATNIYWRAQIYRVDKTNMVGTTYEMVKQNCLNADGSLVDNCIIIS